MKTRLLHMVALILCASATATCRPATDDAEPPARADTLAPDGRLDITASPGETIPRPPTRRVAIRIEGMQDSVTVRLVRAPADFTLRFSTYAPEDMEADVSGSSAGESIRFVANFGGVRDEEAYLQVLVYPPGTAEQVALEEIRAYTRSRNPAEDPGTPTERYPWSLEAYEFRYPAVGSTYDLIGAIALGRHGNRFFHVLTHYPAEYADGMAPRTALILEEWRWEDTGTGLR